MHVIGWIHAQIVDVFGIVQGDEPKLEPVSRNMLQIIAHLVHFVDDVFPFNLKILAVISPIKTQLFGANIRQYKDDAVIATFQ